MTQDQAHNILQTAKEPGFTVGNLIDKINDPQLQVEHNDEGDHRYDMCLDAIIALIVESGLISGRDLKEGYIKARFPSSGSDKETLKQNTAKIMNVGDKNTVLPLWHEWCVDPTYPHNITLPIAKDTIVKNLIQEAINFSHYQTNQSKGEPDSRFLTCCKKKFGMKPTISLPAASSNSSSDVAQKTISDAIKASTKKCVVFTGAPGTGKTYCVEEYVKDITKQDGKNRAPHPNWEFVQFHSSYDYTDFVEGLRPVKKDGKDGEMEFVRMDGIFKAFCRRAARKEKEEKEKKEEKKEKFYFIIDEINRADLGRVFGELMYCFEKRGEKHRIAMQYDNLPAYGKDGKPIEDTYGYDCFKDGFYIPDNVIIIGTMNDIDRSVETFDFALRRRFDWVEIEADAVMKSSLVAMMEKKLKDEKKADRLTADEEKFVYDLVSEILPKIMAKKDDKGAIIGGLNGIIETQSGLGKEFKIGPAYFKDYEGENLEDDNPEGKDLKGIWKYNVAPILREYMRGRQDPEEFIKKCYAELFPKDETEKTSPPGSGDTESAQQGEQE